MKGGPLFLASIWQYLKSKAYPDEKTEWRGGKVLIILDEGVLNTDQYIATREFIRTHFYIKAVVSLTRDTFVPISNTNTKTSIVFAVKKSDLQAVQKEPIFFAHVDRVGLTRVGKVCTNHLDVVLEKYRQFRASVLASYVGAEFRRDRFIDHQAAVGQAIDARVEPLDEAFTNYFFKSAQEKRTVFFFKHPDQVKDRLHYLFYHPKLAAIEDFARIHQTIALGAICREEIVRGEQPEYDEVGDAMVLKTVDLKNGHIDYDGALGVSQEFFDSKPLAHVRKGDILIASTGYMSMGKVDVYDREEPAMVDGHISIVRVNDDYDPYFIAYFLRSHRGQIQFEKWFTGSSGQIELQPTDLGKILVPLGGKDGIEKTRQTLLASRATEGFDAARTLLRQAKEKEASAKSEFETAIFRSPS